MDRSQLVFKIEQYIDSHRQEILDDLKALVRIPSVSRVGEGGKPFGTECCRVLHLALDMAAQRGFEANSHDDWYGTAVYSSNPDSDSLIGIFSHLDVVEAGEGWTYEPFEPTEVNGFMIGRGAGDNKSGAVIGLYTMQILKELQIPVKSDVMLYFGTNEESGMADAERFAKEHIMPDYSMVPDLFFPVCHGEKGVFKATIQSKTGFKQIVALRAGIADNVIPAKASAAILNEATLQQEAEALAANNENVSIRTEGSLLIAEAKGTGGHSAMPQGKTNAIWVLADYLSRLDSLNKTDKNICSSIAAFCSDWDGSALGIACEDEPSGKLVCSAVRMGMDGSIPEIMVSSRYPVTACRENIESHLLDTISDAGFALKNVSDSGPMYIEKDDPLVQRLTKVYHELSGKTDRQPYIIDGGTYARKLKRAVGFGGGNGVRAEFLPAGHGGVHQPDEARHIQGILDAIKIYVMSVIEIDEMIQEEKDNEKRN